MLFFRAQLLLWFLAIFLLAGSTCANIVVFSEDFESLPAIRDDAGANLGGNVNNANHRELTFGQWAGRQTGNGNASYSTGSNGSTVLELDSGLSNLRGAGLFIDPSQFSATGAGNYVLTFDVDTYVAARNGFGIVSIWQGSGYNLTPGSTNNSRLILDTQEPGSRGGALTSLRVLARAQATASRSADATFTSTGTQSLSFQYDGSSAVGLVFGSQLGPEIFVDNIVLTFTPVPEPGSLAMFSMCVFLCSRRRRHRQSFKP